MDTNKLSKTARDQIKDVVDRYSICYTLNRLCRFHKNVNDNNNKDLEDVCTICLEGYNRRTIPIRRLQCLHRYHNSCIMQWFFKGDLICPECRTPVDFDCDRKFGIQTKKSKKDDMKKSPKKLSDQVVTQTSSSMRRSVRSPPSNSDTRVSTYRSSRISRPVTIRVNGRGGRSTRSSNAINLRPRPWRI